jgi:hypothetical protein
MPYGFSAGSPAASQSVEDMAALIASEHTKRYRGVSDGTVIESYATSHGKNVVFTNILAIRKNVLPDEIDNFIMEWISEMIPQVCRTNRKDYAFNNGLFYTFVYKDRGGKVISEYSVDSALCKKIVKNW